MGSFDDMPGRGLNQAIEEQAETAFRALLAGSAHFILQQADLKDYGTDCQIEVLDQGRPTNVRLHAQLKGSERALNADGSLSISVQRTNLNYLLAQRYSLFVAYHVPTDTLRIANAWTCERIRGRRASLRYYGACSDNTGTSSAVSGSSQ